MPRLNIKLLKTTIVLSIAITSSCSDKNGNNKVATAPTPTTTTTTTTVNNGYTGNDGSGYTPSGVPISQYSSIKSQFNCQGSRLANDVIFNIAATGTPTTLAGSFQPGAIQGGEVSKLYVGVSIYNDLMFVSKITRGGQVVGFNVTLSFCSVPVQTYSCNGQIPYIGDQRSLSNFVAPNGIVIDEDTNCGHGVVDSAQNVLMTTGSFSTQCNNYPITLQQSQFQTTFFPPGCRN